MLVSMIVVLAALPAAAQDHSPQPVQIPSDSALFDEPSRFEPWTPDRPASVRRPAALPALYVSFVGLQVYDGYSTTVGMKQGAVESNPLMNDVARNPYALWAVKGGTTALSIYVTERLWKRGHRGQAVAVMAISNALMVAVSARNYSSTRR
jgi:hypothetical protein